MGRIEAHAVTGRKVGQGWNTLRWRRGLEDWDDDDAVDAGFESTAGTGLGDRDGNDSVESGNGVACEPAGESGC